MELVQSVTPGRCECMKCGYRRTLAAGFVPMFVIYDKPKDFPEHIVVRLWSAAKPTPYAWKFGNVDDARDAIPARLSCIPRHIHDETQIVETWL